MHEEAKRRTIPVRIFPNRDSALRLIGSIWQDIHEKWITGKHYLNMEVLQAWEEEQEKKEAETISMEC
jgi:transposase-like protein